MADPHVEREDTLPSLREKLMETEPGRKVIAWWDRTDYQIDTPLGLDDAAEVKVVFVNADRTTRTVYMPVGP